MLFIRYLNTIIVELLFCILNHGITCKLMNAFFFILRQNSDVRIITDLLLKNIHNVNNEQYGA